MIQVSFWERRGGSSGELFSTPSAQLKMLCEYSEYLRVTGQRRDNFIDDIAWSFF